MTVIALHGDYASPEMLRRDMGDLAEVVDLFFDAKGWRRYNHYFDKLVRELELLDEPPLMIGYSRGDSVIAALSEMFELAGAILYEGAILNSKGVGGSFPVLIIWNDQGVLHNTSTKPKAERRRKKAKQSEATWREHHPVETLLGKGEHFKRDPFGHAWDTSLNSQIIDWIG